jgi:HD-like signal output (HDOD) protein
MPVAPPCLPATTSVFEECRRVFLEELERRELQLPVLPQVASQVLELTNDPGSDISDLARLIQRDQSLAGHVLRAANSAAFHRGETITSLQHAVTRLGMKFIADAAFAVSLRGETFCVPGFAPEAAQIWQHALAAGAFGREIARLKRHNVEGQYLCGLLHTVGKPVALQQLGRLRAQHKWPLSNADMLGLATACHAQLGARLATAWKLPRQVAVVCEWYLSPEGAPEFPEEAAMTLFSHELARWLMTGEVSAEAIAGHPILQTLNLYPDDVAGLLEKKETVLALVNDLRL